MPTVWPDSLVIRAQAYSERVLGLIQGWVMGRGGAGVGVNDIREEKTYDQTGT